MNERHALWMKTQIQITCETVTPLLVALLLPWIINSAIPLSLLARASNSTLLEQKDHTYVLRWLEFREGKLSTSDVIPFQTRAECEWAQIEMLLRRARGSAESSRPIIRSYCVESAEVPR